MDKRAFIVDDQKLMSELLKQIFEDRGYEVLSFSDPRDCPPFNRGACHCTDGQICGDIIIADSNMPNSRGLDLIERQKKAGCKIKNIALLSGFWTGSDLRKTEKLGCKVFQKPFAIDEMEKWLDDCDKRIDPNRDLTSSFGEMHVQTKAKTAGQPAKC